MTRTIEVTLEVEVEFTTQVQVEGEDADGNRGVRIQTWVPGRAECLTVVPEAVEKWAKEQAVEIFKNRYGV